MDQDARQIRDEIARDREELASTVQALAAKADVKGRIKGAVSERSGHLHERADDLGHRVRELTPEQARSAVESGAGRVREQLRRQPLPFAAGAAFVAGWLLGRRRGRRRALAG